jgi:hypothetical protein
LGTSCLSSLSPTCCFARPKRPTNGHTSSPSPSFGSSFSCLIQPLVGFSSCRLLPVVVCFDPTRQLTFPLVLSRHASSHSCKQQDYRLNYDFSRSVRIYYRRPFAFQRPVPHTGSSNHQPQAPLSCFDKTDNQHLLPFHLTPSSYLCRRPV